MIGAVQEDKRIRRTKKLLRQALTRLMQQKDFQSITEIGRASCRERV